MVKIFDLVTVDRIRILHTTDKDQVLREIIRLLSTADGITDQAALEQAIFEREKLMSTSIGLGIAIPHVRLLSVKAMTVAVGVIKDGIDYKAFDDMPVNIIIMIAAPEGSHREYLSVLAKLALLLKNKALREAILSAATPEEIFDVLKGH